MKKLNYHLPIRLIFAACLFLQVHRLHADLETDEDTAATFSKSDVAGEISGASAGDIEGLYDGSDTVTSLTTSKGASVTY
ncbi:MAG: hypothetical protein ACPGES_12380, partial [Coraliomargarita sp.]